MRIVRSFHPIGQGAFYSERFYLHPQKTINVVYDCGVLNVGKRSKNVVKQAFAKDDVIEFLFISHLDEDHISLVTTLRDTVSHIRRVVLPYIGIKDVLIQKMLSQALGMDGVHEFWSMLYDFLDGRNQSDTVFLFVYPEGESEGRYGINSGSPRGCADIPEWIFTPFIRHAERKAELDENLIDLLADEEFKKALDYEGIVIRDIFDLKDRISHGDFADLIANRVIKKGLQKAYKSLTEGINRNSLLVYSGPSDDSRKSSDYLGKTRRWLVKDDRYSGSMQPACLYTGDGDFDMPDYQVLLGPLWKEVGTIQIPHHGSLDSFQFTRNNNPNLYSGTFFKFPISCGETNQFGHPSGKVIAFLRSLRMDPIIITENAGSRYDQVIVCRFTD